MDYKIFNREKIIGEFEYNYNKVKEYYNDNLYNRSNENYYFSRLCEISNNIFRFEEEDDDEYLIKFGNIIDDVIKELKDYIGDDWLLNLYEKISCQVKNIS